jgi:hypothetical protein
VIVVPGVLQADRRLDGADADHPLGGLREALDEHEHVAGIRELRRARERRKRPLDARGEPLAIRGKRGEPGAGALGELEDRREIVLRDRTDVEHRARLSPHRDAPAGFTPARD